MTPGALPLKLLVLLLFAIVSFTDCGKLDFYQDVEPGPPEDVVYKRMTRYLGLENHEPREVRRARMSPILPWQYDEYLDYRRQKEKILEALLENPGLVDVLENEKVKDREQVVVPQWPSENREEYRRDEGERVPIVNIDPAPRIFDNYNGYPKDMFSSEKTYYVPGFPLRYGPQENENYPVENMDAERLLKLEGKLMDMSDDGMSSDEDKSSSQISEQEPEFTFKFDRPKIDERDTFAIKPNDPRYYEDEASPGPSGAKETRVTSGRVTEPSRQLDDDPGETVDEERKTYSDYDVPRNVPNDKFSVMKVSMPDLERRAERDPLVVVSSRMTNNDIYFIAIVAGCSAACMFALVLIALTWCRLQRGAKAAADIEYPAYGVTGPNKDISPSGDQRLAHSAQMYHFQHQKQQIIAMESRTAASRDPGSVSEAESDEENEEGDYTVYECPGLAPTGEMEVKNPMFHDDPTPATPPLNHKDEDHI